MRKSIKIERRLEKRRRAYDRHMAKLSQNLHSGYRKPGSRNPRKAG